MKTNKLALCAGWLLAGAIPVSAGEFCLEDVRRDITERTKVLVLDEVTPVGARIGWVCKTKVDGVLISGYSIEPTLDEKAFSAPIITKQFEHDAGKHISFFFTPPSETSGATSCIVTTEVARLVGQEPCTARTRFY